VLPRQCQSLSVAICHTFTWPLRVRHARATLTLRERCPRTHGGGANGGTRAAGVVVTTALLRGATRLTPGDAVHVEHTWEIDERPPIVDQRGTATG
jgi:hypothetical protein